LSVSYIVTINKFTNQYKQQDKKSMTTGEIYGNIKLVNYEINPSKNNTADASSLSTTMELLNRFVLKFQILSLIETEAKNETT